MGKQQTNLFTSLIDLLEHIKGVEQDIIQYTKTSTLNISKFLEEKKIEPSKEVIEAIQYQDIINQQLIATTDAIEEIETTIKKYTHNLNMDNIMLQDNIENLESRLKKSIEMAKDKKKAFEGKAKNQSEDDGEIEFF